MQPCRERERRRRWLGEARRPVLPGEPALEQPDMKPSPAPRTLKTSTVKPGPFASSILSGAAPSMMAQPSAPRLQTITASVTARMPAARRAFRSTACNMNLLLGADDDVGEGKDLLQMRRHLGRGDEAVPRRGRGRRAPQHRAIVDVEADARVRGAGSGHGTFEARAIAARKMRPGDEKRRPRR